MTEAVPTTFDEAIRLFAYGTVIFALGFEAVALFFDGKYGKSGLAFLRTCS